MNCPCCILAVPETIDGVKNTATRPHLAYACSPRCMIRRRPAWCFPGRSRSSRPQRFPMA